MRRSTASKIIAYVVVGLDVGATLATVALCFCSVLRGYTGSLPYLTTLIGALQAGTAIILNAYYKKSTTENKVGGIVYDAAMKECKKDC